MTQGTAYIQTANKYQSQPLGGAQTSITPLISKCWVRQVGIKDSPENGGRV